MPDPNVRVALAGCGRLTERGYAPAFRRALGVHLVGVADPYPERCSGAAPGVSAHPSLDALLAAEEVDAVVIATPTAEHLDGARIAAAHGLPVLVEKPPAKRVADALLLDELDPAPWIGFNRRFDPRLRALRDELVDCNDVELRLDLHAAIGRWRAHVPHEDALLDLAIHLFDLARWLTGEDVGQVRTLGLTEHRVEAELRLGGSRARISCAADRPWIERVVACRAGGRRIRFTRGGIPRIVLSQLGLGRSPDALVTTLTGQLEALANEVRGSEPTPLARVVDGLAALAVVEAVRESHRRGGETVAPAAVATN
jgi:myo-inositol 2-dehydrogenase / D-chiro-inositol 1-dehydrogenase